MIAGGPWGQLRPRCCQAGRRDGLMCWQRELRALHSRNGRGRRPGLSTGEVARWLEVLVCQQSGLQGCQDNVGTGRSQCFSNPRLRTGWAGPGVLVLSALAAEICLLSQAWVGGPTGCWTSTPGQGTGPHEDPLLLARAWTSEDESQALGLGTSKMRGNAIALLK